ncbi:MAG TPA: choice-of-anchor D domain-containing protein [Thiotrichaceae bacterium]|nr:choice-of-anchor D domain-containing protein [Thiotrichaceae bacterium]
MNVFKQKAFVRENANQGPPRRRWRGHFAKQWGIGNLFSAFLTSILLSGLLFTGLVHAEFVTVNCKVESFKPSYKVEAERLVLKYLQELPDRNGLCYKEQRKDFLYILMTSLENRLSKSFKLGDKKPKFDDIDSLESKFHKLILKAYGDGQATAGGDFGILTDKSKFRPNKSISRMEALILTVRTYEEYCGVISSEPDVKFSDDDFAYIEDYQQRREMRTYLEKGKGQGLTSGYKNKNIFAPNQDVPRHESVAFVDKLIYQIKNSCSSPKELPKPKWSISSSSHNFGTVKVGEKPTKTFTIENTGKVDLSDIEMNLDNSDNFKIDNECGSSLRSSKECTFDVVFEPERAKEYSSSIKITSNAGKKSISLSGKGEKIEKLIEEVTITIPKPDSSAKVKVSYTPVGKHSPTNCSSPCSKVITEKGKPVTVVAVETDKLQFDGWDSKTSCFDNTSSLSNEFYADKDCTVQAKFKTVVVEDDKLELDYEVTSIELDPNRKTFEVGEKVKVSATVENTGDIKGEKLYLVWVISKEGRIQFIDGKLSVKVEGFDKADKSLKQYEEEPLNLNGERKFSYRNYELPEKSGTYWLGLCVAANESGKEQKSRSCKSTNITINDDETGKNKSISLTVNVEGEGKVTTSKGKDCSSGCQYQKGDNVILTAKPDSTFQDWKDTNCKNKGKSKDSSICELVMDSDTVVTAVFKNEQKVEHEYVNLTVKVKGNGEVTFKRSDGKKLECTEKSPCDQDYNKGEKNDVTLTAVGLGDKFKEWSKCPKPNGNECKVTMRDANEEVTAVFEPLVAQKNSYSLHVIPIPKGNGTITSTNNSINCGSQCKHDYDKATTVNLKAEESPGFTFEGWSSNTNCGKALSCNVPVNDSVNTTVVTAQFDLIPKHQLTVEMTPALYGTVTGLNITCPGDCSESYKQGDTIRLTAKPESWATIDKWVGGDSCSIGATTCKVTMNGAKTVVVSFKNDPPTLTLVSPKDDDTENLERNFTVKWKVEDDKTPLAEIEHKVRFWKKGEESSAVTLENCPADKKDGGKTDALFACTPSESDGVKIKYDTKYVLEVTVEDAGKASATETWKFTTHANTPPNKPVELSPCSFKAEEHDPKTDLTLSFKVQEPRDNEGDSVKYQIFFSDKANSETPIETTVCEKEKLTEDNRCSVVIRADKLDYSKIYQWRVGAVDSYYEKEAPEKTTLQSSEYCPIKTRKNNPPNAATNPVVNDCENVFCPRIDSNQKITLKATGNRDPEGDAVKYKIRYAENSDGKDGKPTYTDCETNPVPNKENDSLICEIPADNEDKKLKPGTRYIWEVITATKEVPVVKTPNAGLWQFNTSLAIPPTPKYVEPSPEDGLEDYPVNKLPQFAWEIDNPEGIRFEFCREGFKCINVDKDKTSYGLEYKLSYAEEFTWWVKACNKEDVCTPDDKLDKDTFRVEKAPTSLELDVYGGPETNRLRWNIVNDAEDAKTQRKYEVCRVAEQKVFYDDKKTFLEEVTCTDIRSEEIIQFPRYTDSGDEKVLGKLTKGKQYCYLVRAYTLDNKLLHESDPKIGGNCVENQGDISMYIASAKSKLDESAPIAIVMPNGDGLSIDSANVCVGYDGSIIEFGEVKDTIFLGDKGYLEVSASKVVDISALDIEVNRFVEITVYHDDGGDAIPDFETLEGEGKFFNLYFKGIKEGSSPLKFLDYKKDATFSALVEQVGDKSIKTAVQNCIHIVDQDGVEKELNLRDGSTYRVVRKGRRDGRPFIKSRFYVQEPYGYGDVNGNATVEAIDFRTVRNMVKALAYNQGNIPVNSAEIVLETDINKDGNINAQDSESIWIAADIDANRRIEESDANAIRNYAMYNQPWPDDLPVRSTKKRSRDGKDRSIVFTVSDVENVSGTEVKATLSVANVSELSSMGLVIAYSEQVVAEITKIRKTGIAANAYVSSNLDTKGLAAMSFYSSYDSPIEGSGEIAEITFRLAEGGEIRSSHISILQAKLFDKYGRNFVTSSLRRTIKAEDGLVTRTDIPEPPEPPEPNWVPAEKIGTGKPVSPINIAAGQIVDSQGNPMPDMLITVGEYTTISQANGEWVIYDIPAGEHLVTARKPADDGVVLMEKTCVVGNGENCHFDFVIDTGEASPEQYALYGTVVDKDGYPIQGATVKTGDRNTVTDKTGFYVFLDLVAGEYQVIATKGAVILGEGTCLVGGDSNCQLDFTHNPQIEPKPKPKPKADAIYGLQITVIDDLKNPIAGVLLQVGEQSVITDELGSGEIGHLTEGEYTLTASKDGLRFKDHPFEVGNEQLWTELVVEPLTDLKAKITPIVHKKAEQGQHFSYRLTVSNGGGETATEVAFEYQLPTGTELVEIRGVEAGACEPVTDDHRLVCRLPDLAVGETVAVEIELDIVQPKSTLANTVNLLSNEYPVVVAKVWTLVKPYLSVFCEGTPHPIHTGGRLHYDCEVALNDTAPTGQATDVVLTVQLPRGVKLKSLLTDYGLCDTSALPTITCELVDLTIDEAAIRLNLDVELTDPGLLVLINQASVKANGYPTHTSRERTKVFIPPEYKVDMVLVIDVTRSMQEEMNGVKKALTQSTTEFEPSQFPLTALVVFRDDVTLKVLTTDVHLLVTEIGKMKAADGGACPEASFEGLNVAIDHVKEGGIIFLVTDASPYPDSDVAGAIQRLRDKGIRLNTMITGDCSNESDSNWNRLNE